MSSTPALSVADATLKRMTSRTGYLIPSQLPVLRAGSWVSLDTETTGLFPDDGARVATYSVAWDCADQIDGPCPEHRDEPNEVWRIHGSAIPFAHGAEGQPWFCGNLSLFGDDDLNADGSEFDALEAWIKDQKLRLIMHNAQYDLIMTGPGAGLNSWGPAGNRIMDLIDYVEWDSMIACRNLWPIERMGLGPTAARLGIGEKLDDAVRNWVRKNKRTYVAMGYPSWGSGYDLMPWAPVGDMRHGMGKYALEDAVLTRQLKPIQQAEFLDGFGDWTRYKTVQMEEMFELVRMERRGMPYPRKISAAGVGPLEKKQREVAKQLPFAPTDAHAKRYFFTTETTTRGVQGLGLTPVRVGKASKAFPAGEPSLDAEILHDFAEGEVPGAKLWKLHTDLGRVASMYYGGYAQKTGADDRLRARIRQFREQSKTSENMGERRSIERANLQAMPHDGKLAAVLEGLDLLSVRAMIALEVEQSYPGWSLLEFDLSQAELRAGALMSECQPMLDAFFRGDDLHQITADKLGVERNPVGKSSNFALIFDCAWRAFQAQVKQQTLGRKEGPTVLGDKEAQEIVRTWKGMYPEYRRAANRWEDFVRRNGYVPLANGQLRWFTPRERQFDARKGWNQVVQASIQQLFQEWLLRTAAACTDAGVHERAAADGIGGAGPLMVVHDSCIVLVPDDLVEKLDPAIKGAALELWSEFFPGVPGAVDCKPFGKEG